VTVATCVKKKNDKQSPFIDLLLIANFIADFVRGDVTDQSDVADSEAFTTDLTCKSLRLMRYRFQVTEPVGVNPFCCS